MARHTLEAEAAIRSPDDTARITAVRALWQSLVLAFLFSVAIFLHVLSGALYDNWWTLLILIAYVLAPLPLCLFARASGGDSLFGDAGSKAAQLFSSYLNSCNYYVVDVFFSVLEIVSTI